MAKTCAVPRCTSDQLVYSGTDAFMLGGIPTETYCYACANAYAHIDNSMRYSLTPAGEAVVSQTSPAKDGISYA